MTQRSSIQQLGVRLQMIEKTYPDATPEEELKVLRLLESRNALDLAGMLGLMIPQVTNPESENDIETPVPVVPEPVSH